MRFVRQRSGRRAYVVGSDGQAQGRVRDGDLVTGWLAFFSPGSLMGKQVTQAGAKEHDQANDGAGVRGARARAGRQEF